ncbi:MAG: NAD(P)/FAD-dependent oxidoreductase [Phycisphaeraceae bacterium]
MAEWDEKVEAGGPHIVVLGAGFGGLEFCRRYRGPGRITLVDRQNHHLFQPLLYQVATAGLSAPEIAAPVRRIFSGNPHVRSVMSEVTAIDLDAQRVDLAVGWPVHYDHLVLALGGRTSYFGHPEWAEHTLGLKTLDDAMAIRQRILCSFERAETTDDPEQRRRLMTIVVIGGGPTGVELAGACAELTRRVFRRDFRHIDPTQARVMLVEALPRVLPMYPEHLSDSARKQLEGMGVEVWTEAPVEDVQAGRVKVASEWIESENMLWTAGVQAVELTRTLGERHGVRLGKGGRIEVEPDLSIPGFPNAFAIGDLAIVTDAEDKPVPGVAPAAMQMGKHVAEVIRDELTHGRRHPNERSTFRYKDRGIMATIGRSRGVAWIYNRFALSGFLAWLAWLVVHLISLIGFRNKLAVLIQWFYAYVTYRRGARIIIHPPEPAGRERDEAEQRRQTPAA